MAIVIEHVQRGELITADLINQLIDDIENLDARVTALEQAGSRVGAVEIDSVWKTTVNVGDDITIVGKNFGFTIGATRVRFNGIAPTVFRTGSNDTTLICQVPDVFPGMDPSLIPPGGITVSLTVSNATTTAQTTITVKAAPIQVAGEITVNFAGVSPDPPQSGIASDFGFLVQSQAVGTVHGTITSTVTDSTGTPTAWPVQILNATKQSTVAQGSQITIGEGASASFFVRVTPDGPSATPFTVTFKVAAVEVPNAQNSTNAEIGAPSTVDETITAFAPVDFSGPGVSLADTTLTVPLHTVGQVTFDADFTVAGSYDVTFAPGQGAAGATNWTLAIVDPALDPNTNKHTKVIGAGDLEAGNGTASEAVEIRARPETGATGGTATVTVTRQGQTVPTPKSRSFTFGLTLPQVL
jgi:hypothetical protein